MKPLIKELHKFVFQLGLSFLNIFPDSSFGNRVRGIFVSFFVKGTKKKLQVCKACHILYPQNIYVGDGVYIGYSNWINAMGVVEFGNEVITGPFVKISSGDHTFSNGSYRYGEHTKGKVVIGAGSWLAGGVSITKSVEVAGKSVIASGAVVTKSFDVSGVYGGIPAKMLKSFNDKKIVIEEKLNEFEKRIN